MNSILSTAVSSLNTFTAGWQAIANNVANINTHEFHGGHARYQDGPDGQGVRLGEIRTDTSPGSSVPGVPMEGHGEYVNRLGEARAEVAAREASAQAAADARAAEFRESSNVQIEREITQSVIHQHSYAASAQVVSTYDDMMGTVIDMVI